MVKALSKLTKYLLLIVWVLVLVFLGMALSFKNPDLVSVNLIVVHFSDYPLGFVLAITLFVGLLIGLALLAPLAFALNLRVKRGKKKLDKQTQSTAVSVR